MNTVASKIAKALLDIKAIGFVVDKPITFKSGIVSPVYIDNRKLPFHPNAWNVVLRGFKQLLQDTELVFDVIAGIETAGIPHSAALGYALGVPSVFVRKATKDHGTQRMIEGGEVSGKTVLLLEDHITTGGSSLTGIEALRDAGATVTDCIAITSYGFASATNNFARAHIELHTLTSFDQILPLAVDSKIISASEQSIVESWLQDPAGWAKQYRRD